MIAVLETAASYGPKSALVLDEPVSEHGSEAADRLVMTSAEQCSDLDQETARIRASGRVLRRQGEDHGEAKREARAQSSCHPQLPAGMRYEAQRIFDDLSLIHI